MCSDLFDHIKHHIFCISNIEKKNFIYYFYVFKILFNYFKDIRTEKSAQVLKN